MSITNIKWPGRRPVIDEQEPRPWKLPPDLEQQLVEAMDDYSGEHLDQHVIKEKPTRTSSEIADEIIYFIERGNEARSLAMQADDRVEELRAEFHARLAEEVAGIRAEHDERLAELEKLRANVEPEHIRSKTGDTHANADTDPRHAGDAGPDHNAGSGAAVPEPAADQGQASGPAPALPVG